MAKSPPEGTFHIIKVYKDKRDRSKCKNYKPNGICTIYNSKCENIANCGFFVDYEIEKKNEQIKLRKMNTPKVPFNGVKVVDISLIKLKENIQHPKLKETQICHYKNVFTKLGTLDSPLTVSCEGNHYLLEDGYIRYAVAKLMDMKKVPIEIGTRKGNRLQNQLRVGARIKHTTYGKGLVTELSEKHITIKFDSGEEKILSLETCKKNNLISVDKKSLR